MRQGYLDRIVAEGKREGKREGERRVSREREKSISVLVKSLSEAGIGEDFIAKKISENYDLTVEQATRKVEKYRPIPA